MKTTHGTCTYELDILFSNDNEIDVEMASEVLPDVVLSYLEEIYDGVDIKDIYWIDDYSLSMQFTVKGEYIRTETAATMERPADIDETLIPDGIDAYDLQLYIATELPEYNINDIKIDVDVNYSNIQYNNDSNDEYFDNDIYYDAYYDKI